MKQPKHSSFMSLPKRKLMLVLAISVILLIAILVTAVLLSRKGEGKPGDESEEETLFEQITEESESETESEPSSEVASEEESIEETVVYEAPEYEFTTEEVTVSIPGITESYDIAFINDLHLITDHIAGDVEAEYLETVLDRYETFSVDENGTPAEKIWPEAVKFLNYHDFDAVIMDGDMLDYSSHSNMAFFTSGLNDLKYDPDRILYLRADHDYGAFYGETLTQETVYEMHEALDGDKVEEKYLDFGEFRIVGINNSTHNIPAEDIDTYMDMIQCDKPVILVTHVPYGSNVDFSIHDKSMEVRNCEYYWGGDYKADENTMRLMSYVFSGDTNVEQVLAAHLHASWDGMLTDQVSEHIFSPLFQGNIGIVHIVPEK